MANGQCKLTTPVGWGGAHSPPLARFSRFASLLCVDLCRVCCGVVSVIVGGGSVRIIDDSRLLLCAQASFTFVKLAFSSSCGREGPVPLCRVVTPPDRHPCPPVFCLTGPDTRYQWPGEASHTHREGNAVAVPFTSLSIMISSAGIAHFTVASSLSSCSGSAGLAHCTVASSLSSRSGSAGIAQCTVASSLSSRSGSGGIAHCTVASSLSSRSGSAGIAQCTVASSLSSRSGSGGIAHCTVASSLSSRSGSAGIAHCTVASSLSSRSGSAGIAHCTMQARDHHDSQSRLVVVVFAFPVPSNSQDKALPVPPAVT
ncbi:hypothetical protein J6590_059375 [Homalodisca vitripennis]|nr:hypothetical protein J6590_059375 [Homalodisca vitripennis]